MCMAYSNGMDVWVFSQEEEEKTNSATQAMEKMVASGQKSPPAEAGGTSE